MIETYDEFSLELLDEVVHDNQIQIPIHNRNLKEKIMNKAVSEGKDMDGDILSYNGKVYYVNHQRNQVVEFIHKTS